MQVKKECLQQELHILPRLPPPTLPQKNNVPSLSAPAHLE